MQKNKFEAECELDDDGYLTLKIKGRATAELRLMLEQESTLRNALGDSDD